MNKVHVTNFSKLKILRNAISTFHVEGFKVKDTKVFADPLTAYLYIENKFVHTGPLVKLVTTANKAFESIEHVFSVTLTLYDETSSHSDILMTYSIRRLRTLDRTYIDETSIEMTNKIPSTLLSDVKNSGPADASITCAANIKPSSRADIAWV